MISKIFTENRQKLPVFWPKNVIFLLIRQKINYAPTSREKINSSFNFAQNGPIFGIYDLGHIQHKIDDSIFYILIFCDFMGPESFHLGRFLAKSSNLTKKQPNRQLSGPIKSQKIKISKIESSILCYICLRSFIQKIGPFCSKLKEELIFSPEVGS